MKKYAEHRPTGRVLDILEALAASEQGLTLTALAETMGSPKSTIFPIIKLLVERRYAQISQDSSRYSLGISCAALAGAIMERSLWSRLIQHEMSDIVAGCDEVCQMGILEGGNVLYISKIQSSRPVQLASHVGKRLPAANTALGKALLSDLSDEDLKQLYPDGLQPLTSNSVKMLAELRVHLDAIRKTGVAKDDRELHEEIVCFAVPLKQRGKIVAAISVSLPFFRASEEKCAQVKNLLCAAGKRINDMLGSIQDIWH